ncbi:MAG: hypothetical protein V1816_04300 [Pseudomonadota bacterium]
MISKQDLMHKLVQALFESVALAMNDALKDWDRDVPINLDEIFADVGVLTMTTGAVVLLDKLGRDVAVMAVKRLAERIERGDLDNLSGFSSSTLQ